MPLLIPGLLVVYTNMDLPNRPGISVENRTLGPALVRALAELKQPKARKRQASSHTTTGCVDNLKKEFDNWSGIM